MCVCFFCTVSIQPPSQFFAIDSARGIVTVIRELDYETTQAYQLTVNATVSPCAGGPGGQTCLNRASSGPASLLARAPDEGSGRPAPLPLYPYLPLSFSAFDSHPRGSGGIKAA